MIDKELRPCPFGHPDCTIHDAYWRRDAGLRKQAEAKVAATGYGTDSPGYEACVQGAMAEMASNSVNGGTNEDDYPIRRPVTESDKGVYHVITPGQKEDYRASVMRFARDFNRILDLHDCYLSEDHVITPKKPHPNE